MAENTAIAKKKEEFPVQLVWFAFAFKAKCWARAFLNDMPAFKDTKYGPDGVSETVNHLLVPGENVFTVEVLHVDEIDFKPTKWMVKADFYDADQSSVQTVKRNIWRTVRFPHDMYPAAPEKFRRVPFFHRETFDLSHANIPPPVWWNAPDAAFGQEGTPDLRDAVTRFHGAIATGSATRFLDEARLIFEHRERAHGAHPGYIAAEGEQMAGEFMSARPKPRPLDFSELHFEPLHNGRVAKVTRIDGDYVIDAPCEKDPDRSFECDMLLTQNNGAWRVFG